MWVRADAAEIAPQAHWSEGAMVMTDLGTILGVWAHPDDEG